jgi:hypothetical protein
MNECPTRPSVHDRRARRSRANRLVVDGRSHDRDRSIDRRAVVRPRVAVCRRSNPFDSMEIPRAGVEIDRSIDRSRVAVPSSCAFVYSTRTLYEGTMYTTSSAPRQRVPTRMTSHEPSIRAYLTSWSAIASPRHSRGCPSVKTHVHISSSPRLTRRLSTRARAMVGWKKSATMMLTPLDQLIGEASA